MNPALVILIGAAVALSLALIGDYLARKAQEHENILRRLGIK